MLVVFGFPYQNAVVFSLFTVFGNHCSQTYINWNRCHPVLKTRPLIYWEIILIILPAQLAGTNIGTTFSSALPETPLIIIAMLTVILASYKSLSKGISLYKTESCIIAELNNLTRSPLLFSKNDYDDRYSDSGPSESKQDAMRTISLSSVKTDETIPDNSPIILDRKIVSTLAFLWIYYGIVYAILQFAVQTCSSGYFSIFGLSFLVPLIVIFIGSKYVKSKQRDEKSPVLDGDIVFSGSYMVQLLPVVSFVVGVICVLLGLGGAELMAPILLHLKILPVVSSASTSLLSLLFTSSSLLHYALQDKIMYGSSAIMWIIGMLGGLTGRTFALYILSRYKRASFICFALATVLSLALFLLIYDVITDSKDWKFHKYC